MDDNLLFKLDIQEHIIISQTSSIDLTSKPPFGFSFTESKRNDQKEEKKLKKMIDY